MRIKETLAQDASVEALQNLAHSPLWNNLGGSSGGSERARRRFQFFEVYQAFMWRLAKPPSSAAAMWSGRSLGPR
jgi:hypothetical protein